MHASSLVILTIGSLLAMIDGKALAQSAIHGDVKDGNNQPLPGVTILLLEAKDSTLIKGTFSDLGGNYNFGNITKGQYRIKATRMGYGESNISPFFVSGEINTYLNSIQLFLDGKQLEAVTVVGRKPLYEQKIDRMIINVENSIMSAGSTVIEILARSPGVVVDLQNDLISLNGKNGVVVMINGKISHMPMSALIQLLSGMNAGNVEKIELITTPPANLDAEGNAGYINIILKKNNQFGTNGSFSGTLGYSKNLLAGTSLNFNHRKGKLNAYGDFSYSNFHTMQNFTLYHQTNNLEKVTEANTQAIRDVTRFNLDGRMGLDYEMNDKTVVGVLISGFENKFINHSRNSSTFSGNQQPDTLFYTSNQEINNWQNFNSNMNLQHVFSQRAKLQFNADYMYYLDNNPIGYLNSFYNENKDFLYSGQIRSSKHTPIKIWVGAVDFIGKPGKKIEMEAGFKASFSSFNNQVEVDSLDQHQWNQEGAFSAKYVLKEFIPAAYTLLNIAVSQKTTIKVGLRYEYTHTHLGSDSVSDVLNRSYGNLFPSFVISHQADDQHSWGLSYSRRITRPKYNQMAPFVIFFDPFTFFSGNPALLPSISDNFTFNYSFKKNTVSINYSYDKNPIVDFFPKIDSTSGIATFIPENMDNKTTLSSIITIPIEINSWWTMSLNVMGVLQKISLVFNNSLYRITQNTVQAGITQDLKFPRDYTLEIAGVYHSACFWEAYITKPYGSLDASIQKKLGSKAGTLRFAAENILNSNLNRIRINIPAQNLMISDRLQWGYPVFKITYSRNFGSNGIKERRNHLTGAEEELQRVNQ
jgi:Outer membrane protein beta-barrel family/Carboxypeptidase regulatory-like domain